jgi:hypothetical protein
VVTLKADPESIDRYGDLVKRAGEDLAAGREHLVKNGHAEASGGEVFTVAGDWHRQTVEAAEQAFAMDAQVAGSSALSLGLAADYYRYTDRAAAVGLDNTVPPTLCPPVPVPTAAGKPPFGDARDAKAHLHEPVPGDFGFRAHPFQALEALSPTAAVMAAVKGIFHFDPVEDIVSRVLGDWEELAECGIVLQQLGALVEDVGANVGQGTADVQGVWAGNAASAAVTYFMKLDASIDGLAEPLAKMGDAHLQAAQSAWQTAEALKGIVATLVDEAVVVSALVTTGSILIETGVAPLITYGAAAFELAEMYETYERAMEAVHLLYNTVLALGGLVDEAITLIAGLPELNVMTDVYRHPSESTAPEPPGRGHNRMME